MPTQLHPLVADYLHRLEAAAAGLSADRAAELTDGIREHLDAALADTSADDEGRIRQTLDRLGRPEDIVAAAAEHDQPAAGWPAPPSAPGQAGPGGLEVAAVILLVIGGFVAGIGWLVGVALLWTSTRWTIRDKLLGTLVWPFGLVGSIWLLPWATTAVPVGAGAISLQELMLLVGVAAQIAVAAYLLRRARR